MPLAFNAYPALGIKDADIGGGVLQARQQGLQERKYEDERANLTALREARRSLVESGDSDAALKQYWALDPKGGEAYLDMRGKADDQDYEHLKRYSEKTANRLMAHRSALERAQSPLQQQDLWGQFQQEAREAGMEESEIPQAPSLDAIDYQLERLGYMDDWLDLEKKRSDIERAGVSDLHERGPGGKVQLMPGAARAAGQLAAAKRRGEGAGDLTAVQERTNSEIDIAREMMERLKEATPKGRKPTDELIRRLRVTDPRTGMSVPDYSSFIALYANKAAKPRYVTSDAGRDAERQVAQRYATLATGLERVQPQAAVAPPTALPAETAPISEGPGLLERAGDFVGDIFGGGDEGAATNEPGRYDPEQFLRDTPLEPVRPRAAVAERVLERRRSELEAEALRLPPPTVAQQAAIREARRALDRGADQKAVERRLRQNGIDPRYLHDPRIVDQRR